MTLTFVVPLPENLGNARLHWAAKHRLKHRYWETLDMLVVAKRLPKPPKAAWRRAVAEVEIRTIPVMDKDNAHARTKWIFDWLQSRGYVVNDRDVDRTTEPIQPSRRSECGITLSLREAA